MLRFLGRFVLLVGLGFGIGLVIGVATEEPDLLYEHLAGESESVVLVEDERIVEAPYVADSADTPRTERAVATPAGERSTRPRGLEDRLEGSLEGNVQVVARSDSGDGRVAPPAAAPKRAPESANALPDVAAARRPAEKLQPLGSSAAATDRWAIQVGAFADEAAAERLVQNLQAKDYPVAIIASSGPNPRWRVRVQPVRGEDRARGMASQLKRDERLPTWVIRMEPGTQP
jgi:cell division protein FtsN